MYDEFDKYGVSVDAYFVDAQLQAWLIPTSALYSSTAADFAFKLPTIGLHLGGPTDMAGHIAATADIAFPVMHGSFGEDGRLFAALEDAGVHYVGSDAEAAAAAFNKATARQRLLEAGFPALEQMSLIAADFVHLASEDCRLTVRLPARCGNGVADAGSGSFAADCDHLLRPDRSSLCCCAKSPRRIVLHLGSGTWHLIQRCRAPVRRRLGPGSAHHRPRLQSCIHAWMPEHVPAAAARGELR